MENTVFIFAEAERAFLVIPEKPGFLNGQFNFLDIFDDVYLFLFLTVTSNVFEPGMFGLIRSDSVFPSVSCFVSLKGCGSGAGGLGIFVKTAVVSRMRSPTAHSAFIERPSCCFGAFLKRK